MMEILGLLGTSAGILGMIAFLPQIMKTWKSKQTSNFSLFTFIFMSSSTLLWFMYSLFSKDMILTFFTSVMLVFYSVMLIFKIYFK